MEIDPTKDYELNLWPEHEKHHYIRGEIDSIEEQLSEKEKEEKEKR
jgi:hypothetical protein